MKHRTLKAQDKKMIEQLVIFLIEEKAWEPIFEIVRRHIK